MTRLAEALEIPDPWTARRDPVKCLWVYAANPLASTSDQNRIRRGLAREDLFTVVMEQFPTDTVDYADIVLPATMQIEHMDLHAGYGHLYLLWNEPAAPPAGECPSTTETFRRVARAMGLTEPSLYDSDLELAEQLLASDHPSLAGHHASTGCARRAGCGSTCPSRSCRSPTASPRPPAGCEFASARAEAMRAGPAAAIRAAALGGRGRAVPAHPGHPGAARVPQHARFGNNPELRRRAKGPRVLVNPADAAARGLRDGAPGAGVQPARRVPRRRGDQRPGTARRGRLGQGPLAQALPRRRERRTRWWRNATRTWAGAPVYHDNRVEIAPVEDVPADQAPDEGAAAGQAPA